MLSDFIADHCYVVIVVGHDIDRSHQMFVVLNERGKKLQRNDILKSDILAACPQVTPRGLSQMWDDMNLALGDGFEPFFAHLRTIYGHGRLQIVSGVRPLFARPEDRSVLQGRVSAARQGVRAGTQRR